MLCETVKDFVARVGENVHDSEDEEVENSIAHKCEVLKAKLDALLRTLNDEAGNSSCVKVMQSYWLLLAVKQHNILLIVVAASVFLSFMLFSSTFMF